MNKYFFLLALIFCLRILNAQSDAVPKGHFGLELQAGESFLRGKNEKFAFIGSSINGKLDLNVGLSSINSFNQYVVAGAYHFGGELSKAGVALGAGYVFFPKFENYFVFGPTFYASSNLGGVFLVPEISVELATTSDFNFASSFGLSLFTKGQSALAFRPKFVFDADHAYFRIGIGLLIQS